jgi:hypothetical protein
MNILREKLIMAGVKNLKDYGYPSCSPENIMTDQIYKAFFASMLRDNMGKVSPSVDAEIRRMLAEMGERQ